MNGQWARTPVLFILFGMLVAGPSRAVGQVNALPFIYDDGAGNTMPYRLIIPPDMEPLRPYPLILFLHGAGERGDDNELQLNNIAGLIVAVYSERFKSYLVTPQCPVGRTWTWDIISSLATGIVDEVRSNYLVDDRRIYVTGLSMGGFGTFEQLYDNPEKYAAGVPIASGLPESSAATYAEVIKDIPIWIFHGDADTVVPVEYSRSIFEALREAGGEPLYTEYPGVGHNSWTAAYRDDDDVLYPWLFNNILGGPEAVIVLSEDAGAAPLEVCGSSDGSTAGQEPALVSMEWRVGEEVIHDGPSACHTFTEAGRYEISLRVTTDTGFWDEASARVLVSCPAGDVSPWEARDVGSPVLAGAARWAEGGDALEICAGGVALSRDSDSIHFVHQEHTGNATLSARISALGSENPTAQVGLMFRESLDADSRCVALSFLRTHSRFLRLQARKETGAYLLVEGSRTETADVPDIRLRVVKVDDATGGTTEFVGYASTDGVKWEEIGRTTFESFPETYLAGFLSAGGDPAGPDPFVAMHTELRDLKLVSVVGGLQLPGDANQDGETDISDGITLVRHLYVSDPATLPCEGRTSEDPGPGELALLDVSEDGALDISDAVSLLRYLYAGEAPPPLGVTCVRIVGCADACK